MKKGRLFIVSSGSGVGKTSLVKEVVRRLDKSYAIQRLISYTTRTPRSGEVAGDDYFFVSHEEFVDKEKNNFFLETVTYDNKRYGAPYSFFNELEKGISFIVISNRDGIKNFLSFIPDAVSIWIDVPSIEVLKRRLLKRGSEQGNKLEQRLAIALEDLEAEKRQKTCTYHLINDVFEQAVEELKKIIIDEIG